MNALDLVFIVIMAITGIRCLIRGLVAEVSARLAIGAALVCGFFLYKPLGVLINQYVSIGVLAPIAGFILAGLVGFLIIRLLGKSLQTIIQNLHLDFLDSALGLVFGLVEGLAIVVIILALLDFQTFFDLQPLLSGSIFARILLPLISQNLPTAQAGTTLLQAIRPGRLA